MNSGFQIQFGAPHEKEGVVGYRNLPRWLDFVNEYCFRKSLDSRVALNSVGSASLGPRRIAILKRTSLLMAFNAAVNP